MKQVIWASLGVIFGMAAAQAQTQADCPLSLSLVPREAGLVAFTLEAPCAPDAGVEIYHDHYSFHSRTDARGHAEGWMPALSSPMVVSAAFEDGQAVVGWTEFSGARAAQQDRMLLLGQGPQDGLRLSSPVTALGDETSWVKLWQGAADLHLAITEASCGRPLEMTVLYVPKAAPVVAKPLRIAPLDCAWTGQILTLPLSLEGLAP